jgi:DNA-binding transcriptional ArsR family regulator
VIAYRFGHDDLLRTRFAISPVMEISGSVEAFRQPERFVVHAPWAAWARGRMTEMTWDLLDVVIPRDGTIFPDFVNPPPREPQAQLEAELRRVLETPHAQVAKELADVYPGGVPAAARVLLDEPAVGLERLVGQMRAWWDVLLAPRWEGILAMLDAEIAHRGRRLADVGPAAAFADLNDRVAWRDGCVEVDRGPSRREVDLAGRGLLLVPAAFAWPDVWPMHDPPWQPAIVYAPRGVAELWAPAGAEGDAAAALSDLLGARRAAVLLALDRPVATLELAARLGASPAGVSAHLKVLRRAGLVEGRRAGRHVLYGRTRAGDLLLRAASTR